MAVKQVSYLTRSARRTGQALHAPGPGRDAAVQQAAAVQRAMAGLASAGDVVQLSQAAGSRAVQRLVASRQLQARLQVGPASDPYEQEAERAAERVAEHLAHAEQGKAGGHSPRTVQPSRLTQPGSGGGGGFSAGAEFERSLAQARGGGSPLPETVRRPMEQAFAANFRGVRVHTDCAADRLNRQVSAEAFTTGGDIFFRKGAYDPASQAGRKLLAHELTHTLQQGASQPLRSQRKLDLDLPAAPARPRLSRSLAALQRKMKFTPEMLKGEVSRRGKASESFKKIQAMLNDYWNASRAKHEVTLLGALKGLAHTWLNRHRGKKTSSTRSKARALVNLIAGVERELPQARKQAMYMKDIKQGKKKFDYMSSTGAGYGAPHAKKLAQGDATYFPKKDAALELVYKYHLTDAELAAIRIYTVDDFKYINPAVAWIDSWMETQIPKIEGSKSQDTSPAGLAKARQEGRLHGEHALAGMKKMPNFEGDLFRGSSEEAKSIKSRYVKGGTFQYDAFVSCSTERTVSEGFIAENMSKKDRDAGKEGVLLKLEVKHSGRDVSMLSAVLTENEILLMPGVRFEVIDVKPDLKMMRKDGVEVVYHEVIAKQLS
jgi:hypothetical protein